MNDGRLNVSAGLAAYIKTVVNNEFAIHEKKDDIPSYAMYAYNVVKADNGTTTDIKIDGEELETYLRKLHNLAQATESSLISYVTRSEYTEGMDTKLDIEDYEADMKINSDNIKKLTSTTNDHSSAIKNIEDWCGGCELSLQGLYDDTAEIKTLKTALEALTARVQALEEAAKGTEETT